ncbi:hypothetical protein [Flagellimonas zhangzhouensis]|uniref:Uncharacterized protein n=1 Tax=Flagellimonas zhangzhouensis TaxID=1073328 RepID=A0A1H2VMK9_9FLAO|nr:hypothetical protein [Allomuricauda zhangzhouensis]SDQ06859.1 hypothetical protein SAMN05216294_0149 [Allomuricauda zhangzhouensis]SDW69510.1 hypothetical protein SAMN04487892_2144 [Allomuricauda zhangzhouensis]
MEIIWKSSTSKQQLAYVQRLELEYAVRLQVIKILISEAEHLMDYLSLITVEINAHYGSVSVHDDTPEPLLSMVSKKLVQPLQKASPKIKNKTLAAISFIG